MRSIDEIRAGAEAATPGPWEVGYGGYDVYSVSCDVTVSEGDVDEDINPEEVGPNAEFIAHARQDIPDLLDELNSVQCAMAFAEDSLGYETQRFSAALAEKDAEIERLTAIVQFGRAANNSHLDEIIELRRMIELWKTADSKAVAAARAESARLYSVLEDAWYQFSYVDGNGKRWCGGLSTLEDIADVLEIEDV